MNRDIDQHEATPRVKHDARGIAKTALWVVAASFLFGFAMVPIYRIACEHVLGIKLSGDVADAASVALMEIDESRTVTVEFIATVNSKLPWEFKSEKSRVEVHPGALTEVWFDATNDSTAAIVGNAVPSVAPSEASPYFNKTECFCFTEQLLDAGESRRMPVRFVVDPQLPAGVKTLTLSYTFYANEAATSRLSFASLPRDGIASN
ncbi:cytochrome c oxidase assembly protein [Dokdonella sp.]|uniref:cytochrome c oxidase assembly protein n=1 Tax=Dokdonella sp. TaxID=2291710 RepID=UPI003C3638EA